MPLQTLEVKSAPRDVLATGPRVLLVHESHHDLTNYRAMLRSLGCHVIACPNDEEGLRWLAEGPWDLVVVSQGSAAFEGRRVLERAIEINRRTPVLILTRWHDMPCYLTAMSLGAVDYLEEPISAVDLARVVRNHAPTPGARVG